MKLPIVLDTCTILNLLRIDEDDEFLYKKLIKLNINICQKFFEEANKNINTKHFSNSQKKYISSHIPYFGTYILTCDERFESEYKAKIKAMDEKYYEEQHNFNLQQRVKGSTSGNDAVEMYEQLKAEEIKKYLEKQEKLNAKEQQRIEKLLNEAQKYQDAADAVEVPEPKLSE